MFPILGLLAVWFLPKATVAVHKAVVVGVLHNRYIKDESDAGDWGRIDVKTTSFRINKEGARTGDILSETVTAYMGNAPLVAKVINGTATPIELDVMAALHKRHIFTGGE